MLTLFVHLVTSSLNITMHHIICVLPSHVLSYNMCHLSFCFLKGRAWCFQKVYLTPKQKESPSADSYSLRTHPRVRPYAFTRIYGYSTLYGCYIYTLILFNEDILKFLECRSLLWWNVTNNIALILNPLILISTYEIWFFPSLRS